MKVKLIATSSLITASAVLTFGGTAFAWHPEGTIQKEVQDQTTNSAVADANTDSMALVVHPGDTLIYSIKVGNNGTAANTNVNDMAGTVATDTLPTGVEPVTNPSQRTLSWSLGTIKAQQSVTKTLSVKVTSTQNGALIANKACFTGNSTANDSPQTGCDEAIVKVSVPPAPPVVTPTSPAPTQPVPAVLAANTTTPSTTNTTAPAAAALPNTGPGNVFAVGALLALLGYGTSLFVRSRRLRSATNK